MCCFSNVQKRLILINNSAGNSIKVFFEFICRYCRIRVGKKCAIHLYEYEFDGLVFDSYTLVMFRELCIWRGENIQLVKPSVFHLSFNLPAGLLICCYTFLLLFLLTSLATTFVN